MCSKHAAIQGRLDSLNGIERSYAMISTRLWRTVVFRIGRACGLSWIEHFSFCSLKGKAYGRSPIPTAVPLLYSPNLNKASQFNSCPEYARTPMRLSYVHTYVSTYFSLF